MISGVLVETLHFDLLNDPNAVCNSGSLIGAVVKQWNSAFTPPGEAAILHQSKQRIRELVGCCRRYRATASGGSNGRENSLLEGRALTMIRTTVGALRLGVWSGLSEGPSQDKDYQDGDPDQGDTVRPRRSLDRRQALQSSRRERW